MFVPVCFFFCYSLAVSPLTHLTSNKRRGNQDLMGFMYLWRYGGNLTQNTPHMKGIRAEPETFILQSANQLNGTHLKRRTDAGDCEMSNTLLLLESRPAQCELDWLSPGGTCCAMLWLNHQNLSTTRWVPELEQSQNPE